MEFSIVLDELLHPRPVFVAQVFLEGSPLVLVGPWSAAVLFAVLLRQAIQYWSCCKSSFIVNYQPVNFSCLECASVLHKNTCI